MLILALALLQAVPDHPQLSAALRSIQSHNAWTIEQQISICEVPAPPFQERERAAELKRRFEALGFGGVRIDAEGNVLGELAGARPRPYIIFSAHLDTVFPPGMDVRVKRQGERLTGLGIGDDCRGLAVVLAVARAVKEARLGFGGTVVFTGTVGEEGQGNLRGVRHLFEKELKGKIDTFLSIDGVGWRVASRGVGSHRYRVSYRGRGGHSYGAFGMPNPAHALGRAIARIAELRVPQSPKTTFNVGTVRGGTSVNSVPAEASMEVDLRSESPVELAALDERFRAALQAALEQEKARWPDSRAPIDLAIESMGVRPAGEQPDTAPVIQAAVAALRRLGIEPGATRAGSTDSNIPISLGIPAVTLSGGGRGGGAHSLDEWYEDGPDGYKGPQAALLVLAALAGVL
jgi:acetylornithine deacetylase/succinyl-diaminopimelate desuccinylase-like protein